MAFSPLTASAGIFDSSRNTNAGTSQVVTATMNYAIPPGYPVYVAAAWKGSGSALIVDTAGNNYIQLASLAVGPGNSAALFQCVSSVHPLDGSMLQVTANTNVPVSRLFVAPFVPFVPQPLNNPPGVQGQTFLAGTTGAPSISTILPDAYDTAVAIVYGNGSAAVPSSGWTVVQSNDYGAAVLFSTPATPGAFVARPCTYPGTPDTSMILFSIPPTKNVGMSVDNNGKFLPQGLTELRPFNDTIVNLQSAAGWGIPFCCGETLRVGWNVIQPNIPTGVPSNDYNFSYISAALAQAAANGMFINIVLGTGDLTPIWIMNSGIPIFSSTLAGAAPYPCPWDPIYQFFLQQLVTELANQFDGHPNLADITISGFGWEKGIGFCRSTDDNTQLNSLTFNGKSGIDLLYSAFQSICLMYAYVFKKTRLSVDFFSPTFPNNSTNLNIGVQWMNWLFGLGGQFGVQYHDYNPGSGPGGQDAIPEALISAYSLTNSGFAQPQRAELADWTGGIYINVVSTQARCCETYINQLHSDPGGPTGFNSQTTVALLRFVAANWKPFSPQSLPITPAPKPPAPVVSVPVPPPPVIYTTVYGDTFDLISYKIFGSEAYRSDFVDVNPAYSSSYVFESGVRLVIPTVTVRKTMSLPPQYQGITLTSSPNPKT